MSVGDPINRPKPIVVKVDFVDKASGQEIPYKESRLRRATDILSERMGDQEYFQLTGLPTPRVRRNGELDLTDLVISPVEIIVNYLAQDMLVGGIYVNATSPDPQEIASGYIKDIRATDLEFGSSIFRLSYEYLENEKAYSNHLQVRKKARGKDGQFKVETSLHVDQHLNLLEEVYSKVEHQLSAVQSDRTPFEVRYLSVVFDEIRDRYDSLKSELVKIRKDVLKAKNNSPVQKRKLRALFAEQMLKRINDNVFIRANTIFADAESTLQFQPDNILAACDVIEVTKDEMLAHPTYQGQRRLPFTKYIRQMREAGQSMLAVRQLKKVEKRHLTQYRKAEEKFSDALDQFSRAVCCTDFSGYPAAKRMKTALRKLPKSKIRKHFLQLDIEQPSSIEVNGRTYHGFVEVKAIRRRGELIGWDVSFTNPGENPFTGTVVMKGYGKYSGSDRLESMGTLNGERSVQRILYEGSYGDWAQEGSVFQVAIRGSKYVKNFKLPERGVLNFGLGSFDLDQNREGYNSRFFERDYVEGRKREKQSVGDVSFSKI